MSYKILTAMVVSISVLFGGTIYVSANNGAADGSGTIKNPASSLWRGIEIAKNGDTIYVAKGTYFGKDGCGQWTIDKNIAVIGGVEDVIFKPTKCGQWCNATILTGNNDSLKSQTVPMIHIEGTKNVLVKDLILDGTFRNDYDEEGCLQSLNDDSVSASSLIYAECDGDLTIEGCVVFGCSGVGIKISSNDGDIGVRNCIIFNNIGAGILFTSSGKSARCAIDDNQILLTWKEKSGTGFGIDIDSPGKIEIGFNYIAYSMSPAINIARENEQISLRYNKFISNRGGDYRFVDSEGRKLLLKVGEICTKGIFDNCEGNEYRQPKISIPKSAARSAVYGCNAPKMKIKIEPAKIDFEMANPKAFNKFRHRNTSRHNK